MRAYVWLHSTYTHLPKALCMAKRALQCHCTNRLRKTNLLQLFYTLVEDFKMKVMNKIAFLSYCFYPTFCCCTRNRHLKYWTKKVTFRYFSINQLTTSNGWVVEHQMLQGILDYDFNYKKR
jgi:hypothetical protein